MKRYRTIVADPPWAYDGGFGSSPTSRKRAPRGTAPTTRSPLPYESLSLPAIKALPVGDLADADAVLFLWTTSRYLPAVSGVVEAWGFDYSQTLVWHKTGNPSPLTGWIAPTSHAEFLVVGRRGHPDVERLPSSVIAASAPNCGQHSAKPDVFLDLIEQASPGPYVELFARRARFGWDYYGDESLGTAVMPGEDAA